ncbi:MAG: serine/threonine protein kinase, partial [Planctomycetes bacterium]|nr:serine/threonine protein kinase [Planctomycetota bacterium]
MTEPLSIEEQLRQTIADGMLDIPLDDAISDLETVDEDSQDEEFPTHGSVVTIEQRSILSKLAGESAEEAESEVKTEGGDEGGDEGENEDARIADSEDENVSRYETEDRLPSSNNGIILNVRDANLNRIVEARVLNEEQATDSENAADLIHEALILSYLDHPGIPPVYDLDLSSNEHVYCTLKSIQGIPLSALCSAKVSEEYAGIQKYATVDEVIRVFLKVLHIVAYAHSKAVIHRNLKPENFIIGAFDEVYVTSWGSARDLEHDEEDHATLRGTPMYMSPEQANCSAVDQRSDVYSLGASLFHLLFNRPPLRRDSILEFWEAKKIGTLDAIDD